METQDDWKIPKKHPNKVVVTPENIYIGARTYMTIWSDDAECDEVISHASNEFRVYDSSERLSIQKRHYSVALYFMPGYEPEGEHWKRINKPTSKPTEGVIVTADNLIKSQSMTPKDCSEIPIEKKTKTNLTVESEVNLILPSKTKQFNY